MYLLLTAIPLKTEGVSFRAMEYSPLLGGFAVVLADGRGGFLSANTANFECSVSIICYVKVCMNSVLFSSLYSTCTFHRGFIKSWALGKLTSCEHDFVPLV